MAQGRKQPSLLGLAELGKASQGGPPLLWVFGDKTGLECCTQLCGPLLGVFFGQMIRHGPGIKGM